MIEALDRSIDLITTFRVQLVNRTRYNLIIRMLYFFSYYRWNLDPHTSEEGGTLASPYTFCQIKLSATWLVSANYYSSLIIPYHYFYIQLLTSSYNWKCNHLCARVLWNQGFCCILENVPPWLCLGYRHDYWLTVLRLCFIYQSWI